MKCVLLTEDDTMVRSTTAIMLRDSGYEVLSAYSVQDADRIFAANQGKITSALLDRIIPGGDGFEMARAYRKLNPRLNIVIMSAYFDPDTTPLDEFKLLSKPFLIQTLIEVLERPETRRVGGG